MLLQKHRAYAEVYNDLDGEVVNFFSVLRDREKSAALIELLHMTPYARAEFDLAYEPTDCPIERARRTAIRAQMGFGSAGATKGTTGFRIDTKRAYATAQHLWERYPETLAAVAERLKGVLIEKRPAIEVMQQHDGPETLHYADPPYVYETRSLRNVKQGCYRHEMDDALHIELLSVLTKLHGMVVLSGYDTSLYRNSLQGWRMHSTVARMSAGRGSGLRTECLWLNPACQSNLQQLDLNF